MLERYHALSNAQKHTLRRKYIYLFGAKKTFYRKINGEVRLSRAEQLFFETNLMNIHKPKEISNNDAD
jgi:hypothetical protein